MAKENFSEKRYFQHLKQMAQEIKVIPLNSKQAKYILHHFMDQTKNLLNHNQTKDLEDFNLALEALNELVLAVQAGESKYRTEKQSLWEKIFGFGTTKLPDLNSLFK